VKPAYVASVILALVLHAFGFWVWKPPLPHHIRFAPVIALRVIQISEAPPAQDFGDPHQKAEQSPPTKADKPQVSRRPQQPLPGNRVQGAQQPPPALPEHAHPRARPQQNHSLAQPEPFASNPKLGEASGDATAPNLKSSGQNHTPNSSLAGVQADKPTLVSICISMIKPEVPSTESSFQAWISVKYRIINGRIIQVDLIEEKYSEFIDKKTRKSFLLSIETAAKKYICRGDHSGIRQDFSFEIKDED
jgi:hypothetical protein